MEKNQKTTVVVSRAVWKEINKRKEIGETVDSVLRKALRIPTSKEVD
jgi:biotin operon repressor